MLAATVPKIAALAERLDEVVVLADGAVREALPPNVRARLFRAPAKIGRGLRFEAALARELRPRPLAVLAHMCPIYAVLAAPLVRPLGTRLLLWYTHWNATTTLRLAERVATDVVSVDRRSFPLPSGKVTATGHGIDLSQFSCAPARGGGRDFRLLALGRYSPSKGLETMLRGLRLALDDGLDARLAIHGPALSGEEREHRRELERLVDELGLDKRVRLDHAVVRTDVPQLFVQADALLNNMRAGAPDKVVYEAGASCLPVVVSNPVFDELLDDLEPPLRFGREEPAELAERLQALSALAPDARAKLGHTLRERVRERHSVDAWADRILEVASR